MINDLRNLFFDIGKWINRTFDFSDLIGFGGLGMVFYGLYNWQPFWAYIIVGSVIFILAILTNMRK